MWVHFTNHLGDSKEKNHMYVTPMLDHALLIIRAHLVKRSSQNIFYKMLLSLAVAGLVALANAVPTADTLKVCDYLYNTYPRYMAYDPLSINALRTAANASRWIDTNRVYWNNQNSYDYRSACTFFPANAQQVSNLVKKLNEFPSVKFAIKGGGHNPAPGFSSTDEGILMAFEVNLGSATRTEDGNHFIVGPGGRWGDIYKITGQTNQIVVGGRLAHIGVGGFALGGGLSYYSAQYVGA